MRILIDMDDTIEKLTLPWVMFLNERYGRNVCEEDVHEWDMTKAFPGLSHEQVYAPLYEDGFWDNVKPAPGAVETVKRLMDDGHDVYIVTNSSYKSVKLKMESVLFRYFPYIVWEKVILTSNKQLIRGDVLIDDGPHNLIGGDYVKIMPDAPYNRNIDEKAYGIYRVKTWDEIYAVISALSAPDR